MIRHEQGQNSGGEVDVDADIIWSRYVVSESSAAPIGMA